MTQWKVELGFDFDAESVATPFYLQFGVLNGTTVATLNDVADGDTVRFFIFDVTGIESASPQSSGATPSLVAPWIVSEAADSDTSASSPFSNMSSLQSAGLQSLGSTQSTIFNGHSLPAWQVTTDGTVGNTGCFLLSMTITAALSGATKAYSVDPEMIVKP